MVSKSTLSRLTIFLFTIFAIAACAQQKRSDNPRPQINEVLDDWHDAAGDVDFDRYFSHFASDSSIFMGTDATERWNVAEFRKWAKPYFDRGRAWDFTPVNRHIYLSENGAVAWFDESLDTPNLGPSRGSGVLVQKSGNWKIAYYNLSIPIPNAIVDTVVKQVEKALQDSSANN